MVACRPFGPAGELAASRHGALTRSQAAAKGFSADVIRRLIDTEVLTEPAPNVLVVRGSPPTWRQRLYVATLASGGAGAAGYRSAAALHGMDGYGEGPLEILVPNSRRIELPDVVQHRGEFDEEWDITSIDEIRCASIARTLCDLGAVDPPDKVRMAFEWAWRQGYSLTWFRMISAALTTPRRKGPRLLAAMVAEAEWHGVPTDSALEVKVEEVITALPGIVRQHRIHRADGSFVARVDFAIPELKIAIEAHSREHHFGIEASESDAAREAELHGEGWIVRFVTDRQRRRPAELRASLERLVAARSGSQPSAS